MHNRIRTDWHQGHVLQQQIHKMKQDIKNEGKIEYEKRTELSEVTSLQH
ncbi:hypothetical protein LTSEADE_1856 [Salmonella enterica subsp. enterica serovar Adelaide str. A4-669]|uniref:Uncharacterized protein n=1 Tax=Salmonella enterica subsp. enterica serovar Adelaide str. A4-669 TaxID=913063 RepID=A0A6C8GPN3_SALET|nr:hypothetical protein LTSEADE_1856 [Salmonella enterica subsp. enterica serovar Adelaide str. A4-669]